MTVAGERPKRRRRRRGPKGRGWLARLIDLPPVVPALRLVGTIGVGSPIRPGLSMAVLAGQIDALFAGRPEVAALIVNSPGGSPVQSALIAARIRDRAEEAGSRVMAFVEDVAASGGYWLATSADEIYADESSIVGSIGVVSASFGLHRAIEKVGVERRLHTSGERKVLLDPFSPEKPEDLEKLKAIQTEIHESFKRQVTSRRGERLKGEPATLFSGEFWTGRAALELGLVDGLGHIRPVLRERFGREVKLRVVGRRVGLGLLWRRPGFGDAVAGLPDQMLAAVEERAMWARFGL